MKKNIAIQLADTMMELHKHNIIHRDIKPDNVIINKSGHIWLIDYDIARIYRDEIRKDTEMMGTFGYAPIEQYGMLPTDFKTDIYAFGVTLMQILEASNVKGSLLKIAEKCKRLDPSQRYRSAQQIKKAISWSGIFKILLSVTGIVAVFILSFILLIYKETVTIEKIENSEYKPGKSFDGYVLIDEELKEILNFEEFEFSEKGKEYLSSEFRESADIFTVEGAWAHLAFIEDKKRTGIIYMGKGKETDVKAEIELKEGVLSVNLKDNYGHTFSKDFSYNPDNPYTLTYTEDRRQNAELICRDLDGDYIEELLIGINDCSFKIIDNKVFCYFNYSQGWCV